MRLLAPLLTAILLVGLVVPASAAGALDVTMSPPPGQVAVKITDQVTISGTVPSGTTSVTAMLRAVRADGSVIASYDVSARATVNGTTLGGSFTVSCWYIPGCFEQDAARRATVAGYVLDVSDGAGNADRSPRLDLDEVDPFLTGYFVRDANTIVVRFSEDVSDPEGDSALDWMIDKQRGTVREVTGFGDQRILTLTLPIDPEATPEVRYSPMPSAHQATPNVVYLDGAGNDLHADGRWAKAADRFPPPVPTISAIAGQQPTYDGQGQPEPVLGSHTQPTVEVEDVPSGAIAELWLDDGDTRFEEDQDTKIAEEVSNGGTVQLQPTAQLTDGQVRFFARSRDRAKCDPNDPASAECPNHSGRSRPVLYDLETTPPKLVGPASASRRQVVVELTEPASGTSDPADWTVVNGPAVVGVEVDGTLVVLTTATDVTGAATLLRYTRGNGSVADAHGNELESGSVSLVVDALPVLTGSPIDLVEGDGEGFPPDPTYTEPSAEFPLRLNADGNGATVDFELRGSTATAGQDFTATSGTITFNGSSQTAEVEVESIGDITDEPDETFELRLSNPNGLRLPGDASQFVLIGDLLDDDPLPGISVTDLVIEEGERGRFTVTLDTPSGREVEVDWTLVGGTARLGKDLVGPGTTSGTFTFAPGQDTGYVEVDALIDDTDEDVEQFTLELSEPGNAVLDDAVGAGTIEDIDDVPAVVIRHTGGQEGETVRATIGLRGRSEREVTVHVVSEDDTAVAGEDYEAVDTTVTIPAGQQQALLDVRLLPDATPEETERFLLVPKSATNAAIPADGAGRVHVSEPAPGTARADGSGSSDAGSGGSNGVLGGRVEDGSGPLGAPDSSDGSMPATGGGASAVAAAALALGALARRRRA